MFDWFTFTAQVINFLILVALLKHFLYNRILEVMEKREQQIASRLDEAQQKQEQADNTAQAYQEKIRELEEKRAQKLSAAQEEADSRKKELLKQARQAIDQQQQAWRSTLEQEQTQFFHELRQLAGKHVYALARKVLQDLADEQLEQQIVSAFLRRLQQLDAHEQEVYAALQHVSPEQTLRVTSSFELQEDTQEQIRDALQQAIPDFAGMEFTQNTELIGGIELRVNENKVRWSIASYLDALEEEWHEVMQQQLAATGGRQTPHQEETASTDE